MVRGITVEVWKSLLSKTPQFEGRMVASWSYSLNEPNYVDRSSQVDPGALKLASHRFTDLGTFRGLYRGHPAALAVANAANKGADAGFRLGMTVWMANGVNHGEGEYSQDIEDGKVKLRPENRPGRPVQRTIDQITSRYADGVTANRAEALKNMRIGD